MTINKVYQHAIKDNSPIMLLWGGRGSGKSVFAAQKLVLRLMTEENHKILVVRKYATNLRNSVYAEIVNVINQEGWADYYDCNISPLEITCKVTGNKVIFVGLDDGEKIKSIQGITLCWIEEANQITEEDFSQIDLSIRGKSKYPKQIILSFNPVDKKSWLYKKFFVRKDCEFSEYKTTYRDNPFVDIGEYEKKLKSYENNPNYYNVVAHGEWGEKTQTTIFTNWSIDPKLSLNYDNYKIIRGGCDFGSNDPNTVILIGYQDNTVYALKEYYKRNSTLNVMIQDMKQLFPMKYYYTCDSSRPDSIREMKRQGIRALSGKKTKVQDGILWLQSKNIVVHPDCVHLQNELELYQWRVDPKNPDDILDEPVDCDNHLIDSMRYALLDVMRMNISHATLRLR